MATPGLPRSAHSLPALVQEVFRGGESTAPGEETGRRPPSRSRLSPEGGSINGVFHTMSEEEVRQIMRQPWVAHASSGGPEVRVIRGFIIVETREPDRTEVTRRLVEGWYRKQARAKFVERLEASLTRFPDSEAFRPRGMIVRRMEKRWGSLSPSGRLVLNRRLIEAPVDAIDYVITHELCHMAEPHHGVVFYRLLDRVMPDWAGRKERLEERMA